LAGIEEGRSKTEDDSNQGLLLVASPSRLDAFFPSPVPGSWLNAAGSQ